MTETRKADPPQPQAELSEQQLDAAIGGATAAISDGTSNITDGTSNIKDGTSNTIFFSERYK